MKAVILAGGKGTRLFPLSRENYPKQFLKIWNGESLFQKTIKRLIPKISFQDLIIITNQNYKFYVKNQLLDILRNLGQDISYGHLEKITNIIFEPTGRNTAPAIILAIKFALEKLNIDDDEIFCVLPSDHIIEPSYKFLEYLNKAEKIAKEGYIVTFGIQPNKPETGYGYIEKDNLLLSDGVYKVKAFHEKPDLETAKKYLESGNHYWNGGIFVFSIKTILKELEKYLPEIYKKIKNESFNEILAKFDSMPDVSIDYAIMEKTDKIAVIPVDLNWSDVGSWEAFYEIMEKDKNNNVKLGKVLDIESKNSLIFGSNRLICTLGIEDLIIVETGDALLVTKKGEGQKVRNIVKLLKRNKALRKIAEYPLTVYRPWGSYTELEKGERYKIKKIIVNPGEELSLQRHYHRSEHWVVVKGTAKVILEDTDGKLKE
ncbi:MAG TPA: mannose-1-phosphate guanylyltransferase/mannose-6-phosphate isomerase, partial [Hydrogenothermaceae bacterium]|nr:mannose-1-phosphate guanylyltransferase/mannose-6-phosphate isomerase [Hydrogenothermaceae bacterium]